MANLFNENIVKQQQETTAQINALLAKSMSSLTCGPDCQKIKTAQELEEKYLKSQTNMLTAPIELEESKKNYYIFSKGESAYNIMLEKDLTKKADMICTEIKNQFLEEVNKATTLNLYYNTNLINSRNTTELYDEYTSETKSFEKTIKNMHGDILTQDRKSYYETQEYETLEGWYRILLFMYYILVIVFILGFIFVPNKLRRIEQIGILFILIFFPYIINYIVSFIMGIFFIFKDSLSSLVYNDVLRNESADFTNDTKIQ
jgi:hypothetical protein